MYASIQAQNKLPRPRHKRRQRRCAAGVKATFKLLQELVRLAAALRGHVPHPPGLPPLAAALSTHLELRLLRLLRSNAGAGPPTDALKDAVDFLESLSDCAAVLPQPALERCVAALAAVVERLLRHGQPGAAACAYLLAAVNSLAQAAGWLLQSCCPVRATGSSTSSGQQEQQQQAGLSVVALEAVAVCASGLARAAELEAAGPAG